MFCLWLRKVKEPTDLCSVWGWGQDGQLSSLCLSTHTNYLRAFLYMPLYPDLSMFDPARPSGTSHLSSNHKHLFLGHPSHFTFAFTAIPLSPDFWSYFGVHFWLLVLVLGLGFSQVSPWYVFRTLFPEIQCLTNSTIRPYFPWKSRLLESLFY